MKTNPAIFSSEHISAGRILKLFHSAVTVFQLPDHFFLCFGFLKKNPRYQGWIILLELRLAINQYHQFPQRIFSLIEVK